MKIIKQFTFYFVLLFAATSCFDEFSIHGNGIERTEQRAVSGFNKVNSAGSFEVIISRGNEQEILISAEENILPYIETSVSNNTLLIEIPGLHNVRNRLPMTVYITMLELKSVKQSGSGNITTDYFTTEQLELFVSGSGAISTEVEASIVDASISGSGWIMVAGVANRSNLAISGSGNIDSAMLDVENCNAHISGSGNMKVKASESIFARISGSGNIYYYGNPRVELNISGSGKAIPAR